VRSKVDESGFVKDDASRKLSDIRRDQKRLSNEIQDKLQREMDRTNDLSPTGWCKKRKSLRHSCKEFQCTTSERHRFGLVWLGSDAYVEPSPWWT